MKKIFVTGAGGRIGKAVIEMLLQKNFAVIGTDEYPSPFFYNDNFTYVQCEITDKDAITNALNSNRPDVLVHLACTADNDWNDTFGSSEEKTSAAVDKYLYKAAVDAGVGDIIMISTHQIYAVPKTREPVRESSPEKPVSNYAKLKSESEKALVAAIKKGRTKEVIMRVCPIYSKDFLDNLKAKVVDPSDGCAFMYGHGEYSYSFTCLYNICDFIYGIINCPDNITYSGVYNVCDTKPIIAKDIIELLRAEHRISAVISRNYGSGAIKGVAALFGGKSEKTDYRYNDPSIATSNISYDNTKAQRIATFRWKLANTK